MLQQDISSMGADGPLVGRLSVGTIPTALPMATLVAKAIQARYSQIEVTVLSSSSIDILRHLEDFVIDIGLTYLDNEPIEGMRSEEVYMERYCLLVRRDNPLAQRDTVTWSEAARQALCLLTPDMQNRRIVDRAFRAANSAPVPRIETNSVVTLCSSVHLMGLSTVIPEQFLALLGPRSDIVTIPLTDPVVEHSIGLVAVDRDPISPLVLAAFECALHLDVP
jgi:DNA-binding transcriptional LysR family regulator